LPMRKTNSIERGFTLLETVIVVAIMMVLMGMAVIQSFGSLESYRATSAMDVVTSQLRVARQLAISQRRDVQLSFNLATLPHTISYQIQPAFAGDSTGPLVTVPLPQQTQFTQEPGVPDTPMGFGTCSGVSGVCIANVSGGPPFMEFTSTGQFTDNTGINVLNGTIFVGMNNQKSTARAVTIMGGTGRVREYTYIAGTTGWQE
jgi:type II secretory pathway pseudopilin PulG